MNSGERTFLKLISKIGSGYLIIIFLLAIFWFKGRTEQFKEFIDNIFLLKILQSNIAFQFYILILIIAGFVFQQIYFNNKISILSDSIIELKKEKEKLQNKLLKK